MAIAQLHEEKVKEHKKQQQMYMNKANEIKPPTSSRSVRPIEVDMNNIDNKKDSILTFNEEATPNTIDQWKKEK